MTPEHTAGKVPVESDGAVTLSLVERLTSARKGARTEEDAKAIADAQNEIERLQHIKDVAQALAAVEREAIAAERARVIEMCAKVVEPATKAWWARVQQDFDAKRDWKKGGEIGFPPRSDLGTCEGFVAAAIRALSTDSQDT